MASNWSAVSALVGMCLLCTFAYGQMTSPLQGQGTPPENGTTVYVSAVVDRMLTIDDSSYRFEAVLYVWLSWRDPRAVEAINASSYAAYESGSCDKPCNTNYAWRRGDSCCDQLFLPSFDVTNVRGIDQNNVVKYGIVPDLNGSVAWYTRMQAEWYTPLDFKAFPFDSQYLVIQVQLNDDPRAPITIVPSLTGTQMFMPQTGDQISGWTVRSLEVQPYSYQFLGTMLRGSNQRSAYDEPFPLASSNPDVVGLTDIPSNTTGFNIIITVDRISTYYVITAIVPIALNVYLALLVFAVHPKHLDTRLGVIVTLFLALTAILYVVNGYLPASSNAVPTQQLVIVSYFILALIGFMSIITYEMVTFQNTRSANKRAAQASRRFTQRWKSVVEERKHSMRRPSTGGLRRRNNRSGVGCAAAEGGPLPGTAAAEGGTFVDAGGLEYATHHPGNGQLPVTDSAIQGEPWHAQHPAPASDDEASDGSGSSGGSAGSGGGGGMLGESTVRVGAMAHHGDEEEAAADRRPTGIMPADTLGTTEGWWLLRWASCCPQRRRRGHEDDSSINWFTLQRLKMAEMAAEMERDKDYALYIAQRVDKFMLYFTLAGYTLAIVLIFAIGANKQTTTLTFA